MINTSTISLVEEKDGQEVYEVQVNKTREGEKLSDTIRVTVPGSWEVLTDEQKEAAFQAFQKHLIEKERNYHRENAMITQAEKEEKRQAAKKAAEKKIEALKAVGLSKKEILKELGL